MKSLRSALCFFIVFSPVYAQDIESRPERLPYLNSEIQKIETRIKDGQNPELYEAALRELRNERAQLLKKSGVRPRIIGKAPVESPVKKVAEKKVIRTRAKRRASISPKVKLQETNPLLRKNEVETKIKEEHSYLLRLLKEGRTAEEINQSQANLSYLEIENSKLLLGGNSSPIERSSKSSAELPADEKRLSYRGHFQWRTESAQNQQGIQGRRQSEQSFFRLRTYLTFMASEKLQFHLTPQATRGFGEDNSANPAANTVTHPDLSFFEASLIYRPFESWSAELGRQELAYGDHLVIGSLPWANQGRSFDALKIRYEFEKGWSDLVASKVSDNSANGSSNVLVANDDTDLIFLYNSFSINEVLDPLEFYLLHQNVHNAGGLEINMAGIRAKGELGPLFYRTENGIQGGAGLGSRAFQMDFELGKKWEKISLSGEYSLAGADYQQLYPTAHKFLGLADVLGRRNVEQYALHLSSPITSWLKLRADYHDFKKAKIDAPAYQLRGSAWGEFNGSDDIGEEFDFVATFEPASELSVQLGAALFYPGEYMKQQNSSQRDERVDFFYAQLIGRF